MLTRPEENVPVEEGLLASEGVVGVLLANVGSPEAPTPEALRRYLAEFLADPRIIDWPRWLWLPVLHAIVLNTRPRRSARLYQRIWTADGSPQLATLRQQAAGVLSRLEGRLGAPVPVAVGMRYGQPSIAAGLRALRAAGARRVLVFPLFPQFSGTTTASTFDAVFAEVRRWPAPPELVHIQHYYDHPSYQRALAGSVQRFWAAHGRPERLLISCHGIPRRYAAAGDPYPQHCEATAEALARALDLAPDQWQLAYQSRFGPEAWLKPFTDKTLAAWGGAGLGRVDVVCPGFSADCLETLDEIAHECRRTFCEAGGGELRYIPALNAESAHLDALAEIAAEALEGWLAPAGMPKAPAAVAARANRAARR
jgi:ferrochelatase